MPLSISSVSVTLHGLVPADITAVEVDGTAVVIAPDRSWSATVVIPGSGDRSVAVTAFGPTRRETRLVDVGAGAPPIAVPG